MRLDRELGLGMPFEDLCHETVLNIVRTAHVLSSAGGDLFRRFDLTEAQFNVLLVLTYKERELTQSDLGKRLVITRASVTSVLDKLESKGLVARNQVPGNRRIYHISLTDGGRRLIEEVEPHYRAAVHQTLDALSEEECRALIGLLERVRERTRTAALE